VCAEGERAAAQPGIFARSMEQSRRCARREVRPCHLIRNALQHGEHGIVFGQNTTNRFGGVHAQRLQFAKEKEAECMVDVGVAEDGAGNRSLAYAFTWVKFRRGFNLRAEVGGGAEQEPVLSVGTDCKLGLGATFTRKLSVPQCAAVGAGAVPLRKASSGSRT